MSVTDERFPKSDRLRKRAEFLAVQERGLKGHAGRFLVFVGPGPRGPLAPPRMGVTVTKKIGGAVVRNRIKRIVREVFRHEKDAFPRGMDVVVVAKQGSAGLSYEEARVDLLRYLRRFGDSPPGREAARAPGVAADASAATERGDR